MRRMVREIEIPEGVSVEVSGKTVTVRGPKGVLTRTFNNEGITIEVKDGKVVVRALDDRRKHLANCGTVAAHIKNMIKGVQKEFVYRLKIVYAHFPIKVAVKGDKLEIQNFLGEKVPRYAKILPGVKVEIVGKDTIIVKSIDIEKAGQTAANFEQATKTPTALDERKFQDGIYIVSKAEWGEEG